MPNILVLYKWPSICKHSQSHFSCCRNNISQWNKNKTSNLSYIRSDWLSLFLCGDSSGIKCSWSIPKSLKKSTQCCHLGRVAIYIFILNLQLHTPNKLENSNKKPWFRPKKYFTATTIHCGCQNIKLVFRVLRIHNSEEKLENGPFW